MPDGRSEVAAAEIVYQNVTRRHSGHYICTGSNGPGKEATDAVKVNVMRECSTI